MPLRNSFRKFMKNLANTPERIINEGELEPEIQRRIEEEVSTQEASQESDSSYSYSETSTIESTNNSIHKEETSNIDTMDPATIQQVVAAAVAAALQANMRNN